MKKTLIFLLAVTFISCATGTRIRGLREGMSRARVIKIMGKPDAFKRDGKHVVLKYTDRLKSFWGMENRSNYIVILKNGRVVEYGDEDVVNER